MLRDYLKLPRLVHILCLGTLLNRAGSFVIVFLTLYASEKLGFGIVFATACMGAFGLGSMVGSLLGGQLADQLGRRTVLLLSLFGAGATLLVLGSLSNRWQFMATVFAFALITDMYRPATAAMIGDVVEVAKRPQAFALMYMSINLGFAFAPPVGGLLAEISYHWLFIGDAISMFVYGVIVFLFVPETRPDTRDADGKDTAIPLLEAARHMARDRTFLWFCTASFLLALVFMQGFSLLPLHLVGNGLSTREYGGLMALNGVMIVALQLPVTQWTSRFNSMSMIVFGSLLIAVGFGMNALGATLWFVALTIVIWTLGEIVHAPLTQALVTNIAPPLMRARYMGLFNLTYGAALTLGAPLGGVLFSRHGSLVLWTVAFAVSMSAVLMYALLRPQIRARLSAEP